MEPAWASIRRKPHPDGDEAAAQLHGTAFLIPKDETDGLDRQEGGYNVLSSHSSRTTER